MGREIKGKKDILSVILVIVCLSLEGRIFFCRNSKIGDWVFSFFIK